MSGPDYKGGRLGRGRGRELVSQEEGLGYCRGKETGKKHQHFLSTSKAQSTVGEVCIDYPHLIDEETVAQRGWMAFQVTQLVRRLSSRTVIWLLVHLMPKPWAQEAPWHFTGCPSSGRRPHRCPRHLSEVVCFPGDSTESGSVSKCPGIHIA